MKRHWCWILFAGCSVLWIILALALAPAPSGQDVFIFRDAGWNLASTGSFVSAGLPYMTDFVPRLYAHYTPLMPLLFAGFLEIFPKNAYAGAIFNLLVGLAAAASVLVLVRLQPASWYRTTASAIIAVVPAAFITSDRPEALGLILFILTVALASRQKPSAVALGLLIAATFLADPFAALCAVVWIAALAVSRASREQGCWPLALRHAALTGMFAALPVLAVALLYYRIDPSSLARFAQHALVGKSSGLGVVARAGSLAGYFAKLHQGIVKLDVLTAWACAFSLCTGMLLAAWLFVRYRSLSPAQKLAAAAGLACMALSALAFPEQSNYFMLLGILIPAGLLAASEKPSSAGPLAIGMLFLFFCAHLPSLACAEIMASEQGESFRAAEAQPAYLRAQIGSPQAVVAVSDGGYDLFKPDFDRLVDADYLGGISNRSGLSGIANCYFAFSGDGNAIRPLPSSVDAASFHLVQRAPRHLWITLFGRKVMRRQWGYGCDLYIRQLR